ncbi:phytase-like protein with esterase activity [Novosphingobium taihuense]|nr:esterase-like activity of phytase family protein [Novosphingobium taihuense]TWH86051.1 phytase-like protein with esterase activity [Novosphingobium taihuense]
MALLVWATQRNDPFTFDRRVEVTDLLPGIPATEREQLGPFKLQQAWLLEGADHRFGGYSALVPQDGGLLAISDRNRTLSIPSTLKPGAFLSAMPNMVVQRWPDGHTTIGFDTESAVRDPIDGSLWIGLEDDWHVVRTDLRTGAINLIPVNETRDWPRNGGAEAMARLPDGRWVMLCESCGTGRGGLHLGLLFEGRPGLSKAHKFGFIVPNGFDPVDAVPLQDGRLLILVRKLGLSPPGFSARIVLADLSRLDLRRPLPSVELARLEGPALRENWEGMALTQDKDGLILWLVADANASTFQQTRLLRLWFDPARLPAR